MARGIYERTPDHRLAISLGMKGKKHKPETIEKIRESVTKKMDELGLSLKARGIPQKKVKKPL